jgi:hypothetical protein
MLGLGQKSFGQSVLAPPNNNTVVLLIQNLYFSTKMVFVFSKIWVLI